MVKINRKLIILALFILIFYIGITSVTAASFSNVQSKIYAASSGGDVYLDNTTYVGSGSEITVNKNLKIHGGSVSDPSKKSTLDARNLSRIFNVQNNRNVSFINLIIINGKTNNYGRNGGAVLLHSGSFNFINCTFINSSTKGSYSGGGGAITGDNCNLMLLNCNFTNSSATGRNSSGGAIWIETGVANVINSSFLNSYTNGNFSGGGNIYIHSGSLSVKDSEFLNSSTYGESSCGGAIWVEIGVVNVTNANFTNSSTNGESSAFYLLFNIL